MTEAPEVNEDFVDMLRALDANGAEFVVVGAYALAVHGYPRATGDIDILVNPTKENAKKVHSALLAFGAPLEAHGVRATDFAQKGNVYQIGLPPRRIDLLTSISGVEFDEAVADSITATLGGCPVSFIGLQALIRNKRASGRTKDVADAEELEKRSRSER